MPHADLGVRVTPRSSRNRLEVSGDTVKVWVSAAPTDGQANDAVCEVVAKAVKVPPSYVAVLRGHTARDKVLRIDTLDLDEVRRRLAPAS